MKNLKSLLFSLCFLSISLLNAQSIGDTIKVQVLDYSNSSRDVIANFPANSSLRFEKVIMRYAMRCKGALISTGSNRNLGCGEWDYSCNTYLTDSTRADSINASVSRYSITPNTNTSGIYSTVPTWQARPTIQTQVAINSIVSEDTAQLGTQVISDSTYISSKAYGSKSLVLYTSTELLSAGLTAGNIDALSLYCTSSPQTVKNLKIKLKQIAHTDLAIIDTSVILPGQEVYYHNYSFQQGENRVQFHTPFTWNGTSSLLVEISYKGNSSNAPMHLAHDTTNATARGLNASEDFALNLFQGNYVEADAYLGIGSNNARTIEAWIRTNSSGEITTWGANRTGEKQSFWVNGSGQLRLEINGAYVNGTANVADGKWHHVVCSFSGINMYDVRFYLDGAWDFASSVSTKNMNTALEQKFQISKGFHNRYFDGQIDGVRIWSSAVSLNNVRKWMFKKIDSSHPNYTSLDLNYTNNEGGSTILDQSLNGNNAQFKFAPSYAKLEGENMFKEFSSMNERPVMKLYQGTYSLGISADTLYDTTISNPYVVVENTIYPRPGSIRSDSIGSTLTNYWPQFNVTYDLAGNVATAVSSGSTLSIQNSTLPYTARSASKFEIMSFVTPYGINLDLGAAGKAWYYDVTDFLPILSGPRRLTVERGGQNQEELDIQFFFIVGTPPADVVDITQIWRVDSRTYTQIINNDYFEPKTIQLDSSAHLFKVRSAITGHGQEGEFIPRNHYIDVNNNSYRFNRLVWKECAENPVYPQGGTWIYDRAGWCPGMATDLAEYNITPYVTGNSVLLEYGMSNATGDSRYIVNNQLVSYKNPNHSLDARVYEILNPSNHVAYARSNPTCHEPKIVIQNTGSTALTSVQIEYWSNNGNPQQYTWTGNLSFMEKATVVLPIAGAYSQVQTAGNRFYARIASTNGSSDQYVYNDTMSSIFRIPEVLPTSFLARIQTNNAGYESSYVIRDAAGAVMFSKGSLSSNRTYIDTITLAPGCYRLNVYDSNDDGLSFFANSAGNGAFGLLNTNGSGLKSFNPDFGDGIQFDFTVALPLSNEEIPKGNELKLFPNPSKDYFYVSYNEAILDWSIIDLQGKTVRTSNGTVLKQNVDHKISTEGLGKGIYHIHLKTKDNSIIQKLILN